MAPADLRETLAKEQFVDALVSSDMRLRIKQARPSNLNEAVRHAVELEAFNRAERRHLEGQGYMRATTGKPAEEKTNSDIDMITLQKSLADLRKSVEALNGRGQDQIVKLKIILRIRQSLGSEIVLIVARKIICKPHVLFNVKKMYCL